MAIFKAMLRHAQGMLPATVSALLVLATASAAFGQASVHSSPRRCLPVSERAGRDAGCWILTTERLGQLSQPTVFWHLDTFATRAAAEATKGPRGTILESLGKIWLSTIDETGWRPNGGVRVAEIGPLLVNPGEEYTALYIEGISNVGDVTAPHRHPGPEAFYTLAGEMCVETPAGRQFVRAGESVVMPAGPPMMIIATGTEQRRSLAVVLHPSAQRFAVLTPEWTPKGLCTR